ncbi:MAG TPA: glycosyltransferase family 4 protein [Acidimicrobiia bacterium]|nr:glycosyltransferase family 4 protein [Acidimicrobiia bacterium]
MRRIRLCSIQPVAERGGSDQAQLRMLRVLPRDEFECHVVVPSEPPLRAAFEAAGVTVHIIPMRRISRSHRLGDWVAYAAAWPVTVARLTRLLRRLEIDVVHTNSFHSWYGWAAAALARRPHVWHGREIVVQSRAALGLERFLIRRFSARVLSMSHAIADQLDGVDVTVVHETGDPDEFHPEQAGAFRGRVGIRDDVLLVGAAGRVDSWKGFDVLLDAFRRVRTTRDDVDLVVAGGPVKGKEDLYDSLVARAQGISGTHWVGPRDDIGDLLADLDVFVLPSTEPEPYGLVLVEALMSGARVVATDAGGPPEILEEAEPHSGALVPARDAAAMATAILTELAETSATSTARRAARHPRRAPEPERFAAIFRAVVGSAR